MKNLNIKEEAHKLIDKLPENSTWDDLMYQIYVRQTVEARLMHRKASNVISVQEVRKKFGLPIPIYKLFNFLSLTND